MKPGEASVERQQEVEKVLAANNVSEDDVVQVYYADEETIELETRRRKNRAKWQLGIRVCFFCLVPVFWPFFLLEALFISPCGLWTRFIYVEQTKVWTNKAKRTLCILTNKSLIIHRRRLKGNEVVSYYYWGIWPRNFSRGEIMQTTNTIPLERVRLHVQGYTTRVISVHNQTPGYQRVTRALLFCQDSKRAFAEITNAQRSMENDLENLPTAMEVNEGELAFAQPV